jgi:hypothetical protein
MILGDGLIGTSLKKTFNYHEDLLVFASGVSNSTEKDPEEYKREFKLLQEALEGNKGKKLIYFSTCSINSNTSSPYIKYKKFIENYIQSNVEDYLILRLPNIVGSSTNKLQLVNYFFDCLLNQTDITINVDCIRYLVDVEDLSKLLEALITEDKQSSILDMAFNNGVKVEEILKHLEIATGLTFKSITRSNNGNDYNINNSTFLELIEDTSLFNLDVQKIISKYYKKIKHNTSLKVIQFYYSDNLPYLKESEEINSLYCKQYGIDYYCEKNKVLIFETLNGRAGSWYKIPFLREQLISSDQDYIAYIDSDAFIANDAVDFRDIIANYPEYDLILGQDFGPDLVNGGVLIFKNTEWSKEFLKRVWEKSERISRGRYKNEIWLEQTILSTFLLVNEVDASKAKILPYDMPNSINSLHLNEKTFIYHDLSKSRVSDFYKLKQGKGDPFNHINLTTSSDRQVSHKYFDYYIPYIQEKNKEDITLNILDVGGDYGDTFGCLLDNTDLKFNYINLTDRKRDNSKVKTVDYSSCHEERMQKFLEDNTLEFDLIIEDNTHKSEERHFLFYYLFPILKNNGVYVIEDLQTDREITDPHKNAQYGWGDPTKKSMAQLIEGFSVDQTFRSDYYNFEELSKDIASAEIFKTKAGSELGLIVKK